MPIRSFNDYFFHRLDLATDGFSALSRGDTVYLYLTNNREECIGTIGIIEKKDNYTLLMRSKHVDKINIDVSPKSVGEDFKPVTIWLEHLVEWRIKRKTPQAFPAGGE